MKNSFSRRYPREVLDCGSPLPLSGRCLTVEKRWRAAALQDAGALFRHISSIIILLLAGCATAPRTQIQHPASSLPADALVTQRGVLTVWGRQFTLNGYLASSATGGKRLIVTENFGSVLADVLIKPDGTVHVMRSSRAFKSKWIRRYIAADAECIFGNAPRSDCPGQMLASTHFLIERRWYKLDLQIVETKPGSQSPDLFDESKAEKP